MKLSKIMKSSVIQLDSDIHQDQTTDETQSGCLGRVKRSKFLLPLFNYEYSNDIKRFPIGFKDPILAQKYDKY